MEVATIEISLRLHRFLEQHRVSFGDSSEDIIWRLVTERPVQTEQQEPAAAEPKPFTAANLVEAYYASNPEKVPKGWRKDGVFLPNGTRLRATYNGAVVEAQIIAGAWGLEGGSLHTSPSGALSAATKTRKGHTTKLDGWSYWMVSRPGHTSSAGLVEWVPLRALREKARR